MPRKCSLGAVFLGMVFLCPLARAQFPESGPSVVEFDLQSYQAELGRYARAVHNPKEIPQFRRSLPHTWRVRTGQADMDVSTDWLAGKFCRILKTPVVVPSISLLFILSLLYISYVASQIKHDTQMYHFMGVL